MIGKLLRVCESQPVIIIMCAYCITHNHPCCVFTSNLFFIYRKVQIKLS